MYAIGAKITRRHAVNNSREDNNKYSDTNLVKFNIRIGIAEYIDAYLTDSQ